MFSTCSELTPLAPIPDGRMEQIMQPWWECSSLFSPTQWQNWEHQITDNSCILCENSGIHIVHRVSSVSKNACPAVLLPLFWNNGNSPQTSRCFLECGLAKEKQSDTVQLFWDRFANSSFVQHVVWCTSFPPLHLLPSTGPPLASLVLIINSI